MDGEANTTRRKVILIAEDSESGRELLQFILAPMGYELYLAQDGAEALNLAELHTPDLALIDLHMPKVDGYAVAKAMRADSRYSHVPIVAISAGLPERGEDKIVAAGFTSFLPKPIMPSRLREVVSKMLSSTHECAESPKLSEQFPTASIG